VGKTRATSEQRSERIWSFDHSRRDFARDSNPGLKLRLRTVPNGAQTKAGEKQAAAATAALIKQMTARCPNAKQADVGPIGIASAHREIITILDIVFTARSFAQGVVLYARIWARRRF
jgi:hypothetical protein